MEAQTPVVLVVDDDPDICVALEMTLSYEGFEVWTAKNGKLALARLDAEARGPDVLLSDVKMPDMDGLSLLRAVVKRPDPPPVVMISGHADVKTAVDAVKEGAADFLEKPLDQNRVLVAVRNAMRQQALARENVSLRKQLGRRWDLLGESDAMVQLREEIARAGAADVPILITGENGTGKELVARNLHLSGPQSGGPFVAVNCAAIPTELVESELFGHERGSFTGAHERRIGHFEAADEGTLFLDEIGDMPLAAQSKVLRALETREITRVGGSQPIPVRIRVLAATNADLAQAVEDGRFRMDLFYRLSVVPLRLPALRERREDIPLLAERFLTEVAERLGRRPRQLTDEAREALQSFEFPGNVRQLRNLMEAANVLAEDEIGREDLERILENGPALAAPKESSLPDGEDPFSAPTFEEFKNQSEALFFRLKLAENEGNVKRTAERLGMQRSHLYKKLDRDALK